MRSLRPLATLVFVATLVVVAVAAACDTSDTCATSDDCESEDAPVCAQEIARDTCIPAARCIARAAEGEGCAGTDSFCGSTVSRPCRRGLVCASDSSGCSDGGDGQFFFTSCCRAP